jgi:hypothetical protein
MRWEGHIARTGGIRRAYRLSVGKCELRNRLVRQEVDKRIILKRVFQGTAGEFMDFIRL